MKFPNIRARRDELKLTQEQVARAANIGLRHYHGIEVGGTVPGVAVAGQIATVLETTVDHLWELGRKAV